MKYSMGVRRAHGRLFLMGGAVFAAASSQASAQVSFDLLTRFALGWGEEAVPITEPLQITKPGVYNFELQEGVFNAQGFTNWGVANWIGSITASEPTLTRPANPRPAPFNQMGRDGDINAAGTVIGTTPHTYIDSAHPWERFYYTDTPPLPTPYGAEEYVPVYQFSLVIEDLTPREITIRAEAGGLSRPLNDYVIMQHDLPDPETGAPGFIEYRYLALPATFAQTAELSMTFLQIIPAPGAGIALGMIGMMGAVRRRR